MPWAKLDDRFHDNRKVRRAWRACPASIGLYVMAITYSCGNLTSGAVDAVFVEDQIPNVRARKQAVDALVNSGLWVMTDDGWEINDFAEFNHTREQVEAKRQAKREAGRLGGLAKAAKQPNPPPTKPLAGARQDAKHDASPSVNQGSTPEPDPTRTGESQRLLSAPPTEVQQVFEAWLKSTGRTTRTVLDSTRRRFITNALKLYPLADLLDAVDGWRFSPHHRGENDRATVYNDLDVLLKSSKQVEKFRDLKRGATHLTSNVVPITGTAKPSVQDRWADRVEHIDYSGGVG